MRNPNWTRDELILALNLYERVGRKQLEASHPEVLKLSDLLKQLPIHDVSLRNTDFRNPQGVSMKLGNFSSVDPLHAGRGLQRGGKLDKEVWDEFEDDISSLHQAAISIAKIALLPINKIPNYTHDIEDEEFPEGKLLTRLHKAKERNKTVVKKKKEKVLQETGRLACEACSFDFAKEYGNTGYGYAECHHNIPVVQLDTDHGTRLKDLSILCANCHRMIHRSRPIRSVQELRALVESMRTSNTVQT